MGLDVRPSPDLRASDQDRDTAAERLRGHHADGRLDTDELAERIDRCYQAKTISQLDRLLSDLPRPAAGEPRLAWHWPAWRLAGTIIALVVPLAAISALTGRPLIWLAIPLALLARRLMRRPARASATRHPPWSAEHRAEPF